MPEEMTCTTRRDSASDRSPIHESIDLLTAALLDVQQLQRHDASSLAGTDGLADNLQRLEQKLRALGASLLRVRDQTD